MRSAPRLTLPRDRAEVTPYPERRVHREYFSFFLLYIREAFYVPALERAKVLYVRLYENKSGHVTLLH